MDQPRRYRSRPGAVGTTRSQIVVVVLAVLVALAGLVALVAGAGLVGAIMLGLGAVVASLTMLVVFTSAGPPSS